ncbi:UNVERIFIED_CONTAM: hypothetical protein O8I53_11495 [Campylobacter lari]
MVSENDIFNVSKKHKTFIKIKNKSLFNSNIIQKDISVTLNKLPRGNYKFRDSYGYIAQDYKFTDKSFTG